jgi:hypothetical protein
MSIHLDKKIGVICVICGLFAILLYLPSLGLPIIYDDLLHIRIAGDLTLWTVWLPTEAFGFYRPMTFVPLLLIDKIWGYYPAALLHGLNIVQHGLNSALLAFLTWQLWRRWSRAFVTGLLFALFPFSYQAVAVYGHNVHPTIVGLMLIGLLAYAQTWRLDEGERGRKGWLAVMWGCFGVALLTHETAVLFGPFAALVHFARREGKITNFKLPVMPNLWRQPWLWLTAAGGAYLVLYQFLPISRAPQAAVPGESFLSALGLKGLYLAQAASYPLAGPIGWAVSWPATIIVALSFALTLGLTLWAAQTPGRRRPLLLAWGWWGLAGLVIAVPLPSDYLLHGPRLLYLSSVGLAWLWALLLEPLAELAPAKKLRGWWLALILLAGLLLSNGWFIHGRLQQYRQLTEPVRVIQQTIAEQPPAQAIVTVNLPEWLSPARNQYPVGAEVVAMLGPYLFTEELFLHNLRQDRPVANLILPDYLARPAYNYGLYGRQTSGQLVADWHPAGSHLFITLYQEDGPETIYSGAVLPGQVLEEQLAVMDAYRLVAAAATWCDTILTVSTSWQITAGSLAAPGHSLFVQALDGDGRLQAQLDGPPLRLPPDRLQLPAGWQMDDERLLPAPAAPAVVLVGVYDYLSGERVTAVDSQANQLPDNAFTLIVQPCP